MEGVAGYIQLGGGGSDLFWVIYRGGGGGRVEYVWVGGGGWGACGRQNFCLLHENVTGLFSNDPLIML